MADPRTLDNESLAKLLDDEARFRPVYNGDMAPVMREAAVRLREIAAPALKPGTLTCLHCQRTGNPPDCPFETCPAGVEF